MGPMAKDLIFDIEQLIFTRLREGVSKLGSTIMYAMNRNELHRWLAMPIYASTFRASPSLRTDKLAPVHLYDESVKVIAQVEVDYVLSVCDGSQFASVPVMIYSKDADHAEAIRACHFLNVSLHQSQMVSSPGFVAVKYNGSSISVSSYSDDGSELRKMIVEE